MDPTHQPTELLIFVGYSQDAREEALAISSLKPLLQDTLKHLNQVASTHTTYSALDIFQWETKADLVVGGQSSAINPHLERAAIAVFVFKERVGAVTWEELNNFRNRPKEKRIPILVLFPSTPPSLDRLTTKDVARSWADLLDRKSELTEDWNKEESRSITPLESYRDLQHLKEIILKRIEGLLPSLIIANRPIQENAPAAIVHAIPSNHLDVLTELTQFDIQAVQQYRSQMRSQARLALPADLTDDEFLRREGYIKTGRLTLAGALLFTSLPSKVVPSALIRCSKYDGDDKATSRDWHNCDGPLLKQIFEARDFIANSIGRRERPVASSMQSTSIYEYPMICIREILANAVCHRNYEDAERLTYVTIYKNRIEIKSPGTWYGTPLPKGKAVLLTRLVSESVQRNMRLAHAISSVGVVEVEGSGIPTAINDCLVCEAPEPTVEQRDGYVIVTIYPRDDWATEEGYTGPLESFTESGIDVRQSPEQSRKNTEVRTEAETIQDSSEIIGQSEAIKYVFFKIQQVAPTDATVLLTGETGTGKELIARAIHQHSSRKDQPLVKVNCAALPSALTESELFGHERGAFTGAVTARRGRFEIADGGTIFLDEIGELPWESQAKLLRVIQEGEFERIGGSRTVKVDVRIIAATNRKLESLVEAGLFRQDLWYRLNVYPIHVPPLRKRAEDIRLLSQFFIRDLSKKLEKEITSISASTMKLLEAYSWPGNVRELQNVLERAVIHATGPTLHIVDDLDGPRRSKSLEEVEREHILRVLEDTGWEIEGENGAARSLGLSNTALRSRMRKLGISKQKPT